MMNMVIVEGVVREEPVLNGNYFCNFGLVVERNGDRRKMKGPTVDFIQCEAKGAMAAAFAKNIHKNNLVLVTGWLRSDHYDDIKNRTIYKTYVECSFIKYLSQPVRAVFADGFLDENPEIAEQYREYAKERRRKARELNHPEYAEDPAGNPEEETEEETETEKETSE